MNISNTAQPKQPPNIWCDFNAQGWSGEPDDNCYYVLDDTALLNSNPRNGTRVFIFDYENVEQTEIVGCEATLEWVVLAQAGWRARPDEETWYWGPIRW